MTRLLHRALGKQQPAELVDSISGGGPATPGRGAGDRYVAASEWINPVVAIFSMLCTSVKYSHWIRTLARPRSVNRRIPLVAVHPPPGARVDFVSHLLTVTARRLLGDKQVTSSAILLQAPGGQLARRTVIKGGPILAAAPATNGCLRA